MNINLHSVGDIKVVLKNSSVKRGWRRFTRKDDRACSNDNDFHVFIGTRGHEGKAFPIEDPDTLHSEPMVFKGEIYGHGISKVTCTSAKITVSATIGHLYKQCLKTGDITGSRVDFSIMASDKDGSWIERSTHAIKGKTTTPYRKSFPLQLKGSGPWTITMTQTDEKGEILDRCDSTIWFAVPL